MSNSDLRDLQDFFSDLNETFFQVQALLESRCEYEDEGVNASSVYTCDLTEIREHLLKNWRQSLRHDVIADFDQKVQKVLRATGQY